MSTAERLEAPAEHDRTGFWMAQVWFRLERPGYSWADASATKLAAVMVWVSMVKDEFVGVKAHWKKSSTLQRHMLHISAKLTKLNDLPSF